MYRHLMLIVLLVLTASLLRQCPVSGNYNELARRYGWRQDEQTGDVRDYDLTKHLKSSQARRADLAGVSVTIGSPQARGGLTSTPPSPAVKSAPTPQGWYVRRPGRAPLFLTPGRSHVPSGTQRELVTFETPNLDRVLKVAGVDWAVTFHEDHIEIVARSDTEMEFNDRGVESRALLSAGTHKIDLRGFSAAVSFDAAADTLDIVLSEGELKIGVLGAATSTAILAVSPDSDMALAVHVGADGSVEHREIAFDEAVQRFSPEFRSLSFAVEMVEPVPQSKAESELLWIAMLDMDGDPATGQTVGNIMYSGLGADMLVALPLQEDGRIKGDAFFPADENISIPVEAEIAEDRRAFRIHIPLAELLAKAEALGISFAPDTLRWRFAAINHSDPDHAKDIYPELDFDFETGESGAPIPAAPVEAGPQPPPGVAFSVSVSIANGGPKAEFQDKTTSPDADNPIVEWLWDFGDGTTSTVQNPSHTYEAAGEYTATLTITFADGATMSGIVPIKLTRGSGVPPAEGQPCTIGGAGVNLRAGPGTDYDAVRKLAAGENAPVDGQTTGADGFVWWRLVEGVWARSDVVTETGGCESVPVVTP